MSGVSSLGCQAPWLIAFVLALVKIDCCLCKPTHIFILLNSHLFTLMAFEIIKKALWFFQKTTWCISICFLNGYFVFKNGDRELFAARIKEEIFVI